MDIFEEIEKSLKDEEHIMLATILSTTGSTPAGKLSKMLIRNQGLASIGTVGGGCLEAEVLASARSLYGTQKARISTFHLNEDNADSGLICGGSLDVLIEPIDRSFLSVIKSVLSSRERGEDGVLVTILENQRTTGKFYLAVGQSGEEMPFRAEMKGAILESAREVMRTHKVSRFGAKDAEVIVEPVPRQPSLILFGGGHVSKFVSRFASQVGFRVTIVDDRVAFANKDRFPEAAEVIYDGFLSAIDRLSITQNTYLAVITRGHKSDETVLERILHSDAKYIGVIGSRRKILTAYKHYLAKGIPRELLDRVHGPIGLDIGAITAEEIGLSIVAELVRVRRGAEDAGPAKSAGMSQLLASLEENMDQGES
jgi:xanthine dehydrogenase accessory factor